MEMLPTTLGAGITRWHQFVETRDKEILAGLLADNCVFHSPFLWQPKTGKALTMMALTAASQVFEGFQYHRTLSDGSSVMLEFSATVGAFSLKGIDLIRFDEAGQMTDFEVMIRPFKGLQALAEAMAKQLVAQGDYEDFSKG